MQTADSNTRSTTCTHTHAHVAQVALLAHHTKHTSLAQRTLTLESHLTPLFPSRF